MDGLRRAKYGGLPLNFRMTTSSDEEDLDRGDPYYYEIPLVEDPVPTKEIIEERLRSRTGESSDAMGFVSESGTSMDNPLLGYAKCEAVGDQPSKTILVLFADATETNENIPQIQ
ncbi:hypothetical protein TELCIR_21067, partial [Teladorsagia circumcincta]